MTQLNDGVSTPVEKSTPRELLNEAYGNSGKFNQEFEAMSGAEQLQAVRDMVSLNAEDRKEEPSLPMLEYATFDNTYCESSELLSVSLQNERSAFDPLKYIWDKNSSTELYDNRPSLYSFDPGNQPTSGSRFLKTQATEFFAKDDPLPNRANSYASLYWDQLPGDRAYEIWNADKQEDPKNYYKSDDLSVFGLNCNYNIDYEKEQIARGKLRAAGLSVERVPQGQ
jgi:hypothetical protein